MTSRAYLRGNFFNPKRFCLTVIMVCLIVGLVAVSCSRREEVRTEFDYPQPRYPRYLVNPNTDDLLNAARVAVSQPTGRAPLGKMQSGQTVYVFLQWPQDMEVWEAIRQAWAEKGVEAHGVSFGEVLGMSKEEFDETSNKNAAHGNEAWKELGNFREEYRAYFPESVQKEFGQAFSSEYFRKHMPAYLDEHPEIRNFYAGSGGGGFWTQALGEKHADKFQGNFIFTRPVDLLSKAAEFPADVWNLVDEKTLRPIPFISEVTFQDPEGTNLAWTLTPEQSSIWSRNSGSSNHIYVYPSPLHSSIQEGGVLAAHSNHTGVFSTMKVYLDQYGAVERIEGGGRVGELFGTLVNHPILTEAKFPGAAVPGYWFFRQDGFASNPKFVRSLPDMVEGGQYMANLSERNRAGIQHLAFSYDSDNPEDLAYAREQDIPLGRGQHTSHMHNYFPTVQWRLRDTGEWIAIAEKGYVTMFDDPEVRALAARYGDPELLFRYEWNPSIPGVNVGGEYEKDFAQDPWNWIMAEWEQIQAGAYEYFVEDYSLDNPVAALDADRP